MKKVILLAAFGVAGLVNAKGTDTGKVVKNNENIEATTVQKTVAYQECGVVVTYWSGGQIVGQETITSDQPDLQSCQNFQTGVKVALWAAGFWLN
ncbi:hypothetical protein C8D70_101287 [Chryseobacterium sp. CBTAP 102]|jgi:hypothetical protein|uniref:hypothetical protein n=1 Tax=Chryseobacterium sp. CBTAP 102 TaxID=2135644 RepID=UPI000D7750E4|nr:hypothetical protein [Chryseobacterium sp. CBTAP 102]PXW17961.1 hypothetical protein C8D70_101287 [Chryseobacterium sp. CBTAP 102]